LYHRLRGILVRGLAGGDMTFQFIMQTLFWLGLIGFIDAVRKDWSGK